LLRAHPKANWHEHGPIHKHEDELHVQVYFGQHEWGVVNVEDSTKIFFDPGWEGTEYGWGYISEADVDWGNCPQIEIFPPECEGKPITSDQWLLARPDKLVEYLGPNDPLIAKLNTEKE